LIFEKFSKVCRENSSVIKIMGTLTFWHRSFTFKF
jgi:hypothetical protein